jgi:hypothetical protein
MTDTITRVTTPATLPGLLLVTGYETGRRIENVLHGKLHSADYLVTYRPARLRAGSLLLLFATAADAHAAVTILSSSSAYDLTADEPTLNMRFVLAPGELRPRPAEPGAEPWLLEVPFQEVPGA